MDDGRRHGRVQCVVPQHFFHAVKFESGGFEVVPVFGSLPFGLLLLRSKFGLAFHEVTSSGFLEKRGKSFAGARFIVHGARKQPLAKLAP